MPGRPSTVRIEGPLQLYAQGFAAELARQGCAEGTASHQLHLLAHLSRWLGERRLDPEDLTGERATEFLRDRRASGRSKRCSARGLAPLLQYLREVHAVPEAGLPIAATPLAHVADAFATYLAQERGLSPQTIAHYQRFGGWFLSALSASRELDPLGHLTAGDVSVFLLAQSAQRSDGSLGNVASGLRALLRFLYMRGYTTAPMVAAVLGPVGWRRDSLPKALEPGEVTQLLGSVDRTTGNGRRDFAILLLLVRLGLRAGEVAALCLDDVDWRTGVLQIPGKGRRREPLPLPVDVGEALADYCTHDRRHGDCRSLFLQGLAPHGSLSRMAITALVYRRCLVAGLPRYGAHRLRHTAATDMRRAGVGLAEIGQVLRHRDLATTALYAREDIDALRTIAAPWPGGAR